MLESNEPNAIPILTFRELKERRQKELQREAHARYGNCIEGCGAEAERGGLWCSYHMDLLREANEAWRLSFYGDADACGDGFKSVRLEHEYGPNAPAAHTSYPVVGGL